MKTLSSILNRVGYALIFLGAGSLILNSFGYDLEAMQDLVGEGPGIRIGMIVIGAILAALGFLAGKQEKEAEKEDQPNHQETN